MFEEWLIDHEAACNIGNWQWLSCTAFYSQFYRCYSPIAFPQKTDKNGDFVRRYVSELKDYPSKYIYEPWKAPIKDQKDAGCLIKGDGSDKEVDGMKVYPKPMFDFAERREVCIKGLKNAYAVGLYGDDPRVLDGTWRKLFDDAAVGATEGKSEADAPKVVRYLGDEGVLDGDTKHAKMEHADQEVEKKVDVKHAGDKRKRTTKSQSLDGFVTRSKAKKL